MFAFLKITSKLPDPGETESEEEDDFIMISETITTRSGRVASRFSTVILR